jgi:hypothetical protein
MLYECAFSAVGYIGMKTGLQVQFADCQSAWWHVYSQIIIMKADLKRDECSVKYLNVCADHSALNII